MPQSDESPNPFLSPVDDGLLMRETGSWAKEKLHYVKRYIDVFITSMRKKPWRSTRYIDLFAGPGKCRIENTSEVILGSPLISLNASFPFKEHIFVEAYQPSLNALASRCSTHPTQTGIKCLLGDGNVLVKQIADEIMRGDQIRIPGQWWSLNLAFLDPEGLELTWETVSTLGQVQRMDLIIHYSQIGLTRNLEKFREAKEETIIDRFFGDDEWRRIFDRHRQKGSTYGRIHRDLLDYYKLKLRTLGYVDVQDSEDFEPLIRNTQRNAPLYRLIFASKHELGHKFWNEITQKDVHGQQRLL